MQHTMTATLVGAEARPYKGFIDAAGRTVPAGYAYRLWLSESFEVGPLDVRCSLAQFNQYAPLGSGAQVEVVADVLASDNRLGFKLVDLIPVSATLKAVAANGSKS